MTTGYSIAAIVRAAKPGSGVVISSGLYRETLVIDKPLQLVDDGSEGVVELGSRKGPGIVIKGTDAEIRGLTLHGRSQSPLITVLDGGRLLIEDCTLRGGSPACIVLHDHEIVVNRCRISKGKIGVLLDAKYGSQSILTDCQIYENEGPGIRIEGESNPTIKNCEIHDNEGSGIDVKREGEGTPARLRPTVAKCRIYSNDDSGISFYGPGIGGEIQKCEIRDCKWGIFLDDGAYPQILDREIHKCKNSGIVIGRGYQETGVEQVLRTFVHSAKISKMQGAGILILEQSAPIIWGVDIRDCCRDGIIICSGSNPTLRELTIEHNVEAGIVVKSGGRGVLLASKVRENGEPGLHIEDGGDLTVGDGCEID